MIWNLFDTHVQRGSELKGGIEEEFSVTCVACGYGYTASDGLAEMTCAGPG